MSGRVIEEETQRPIPGALIRIEDPTNAGRSGITGKDGLFSLRVDPDVVFRVMIDMIGRAPWASAEQRLTSGDTVFMDARLKARVIELGDLVATSRRRCGRIESEQAVYLDDLWRNAMTALRTEMVGRSSQPLSFTFELYQRDVTNDSMVVASDQRQEHVGAALAAFGAAPIAQLDSMGFHRPDDRGGTLFGPSSEILVERWFLDTHCIEASRSAEQAGLIGIDFVPNTTRQVPEIEGTIWLDSTTYDLRQVTFRFVHLRTRVLPDHYSGSTRYERLDNGALILTDWVMRSPMLRMRGRSTGVLAGVHEVGGSVVQVTLGSDTLFRSLRGRIAGRVRDQDGQPVGGVTVFLRGTAFEAVSDSSGVWAIADVPAGAYIFGYEHSGTEDRDRASHFRRVIVEPGKAVTIDISVRSGQAVGNLQ